MFLAAALTATGGEPLLANLLQSSSPEIEWSADPQRLFSQTKQFYRPNLMEEACDEAYRCHSGGDHTLLKSHLSVDEVRELSTMGWEIGNHTYGHRILGTLDKASVFAAIERNQAFWAQAGIDLIPFLGYPIGRAQDVNVHVLLWLQKNPQMHGIFANGGVNFLLNRTQWLRFSLSGNTDQALLTSIGKEIQKSRQVLAKSSRPYTTDGPGRAS